MAALTPVPKIQFFDANGQPLVGGKLYSYAAGTTVPLSTYVDQGQTAVNTNPVIMDSRGEASVWLDGSSYKLRLTTADDVDIWTVDNITAAAGGGGGSPNTSFTATTQTATAGQTVFTLTNSYIPGNQTLSVYVNGLRMVVNVDYTETSSTSVTFASGLTAGDEVTFLVLRSLAIGTADAANVSYTPAGTGAVVTSVQTKLRETVSVKDFGAVGDGVADDTVAMQAAADYAWNNGKQLFIPAGTYKAKLTLPPAGTTEPRGDAFIMQGEGAGSVFLGGAPYIKGTTIISPDTSPAFNLTNVLTAADAGPQVHIRDIRFEATSTNPVVQFATWNDFCEMRNCEVRQDGTGSGINMIRAYGGTIRDTHIANNNLIGTGSYTGTGVNVGTPYSGALLTFQKVSVRGFNTGFNLGSGGVTYILNTTLQQCECAWNNYGIIVNAGMRKTVINECYFEEVQTVGVQDEGEGTTISNCLMFEGCATQIKADYDTRGNLYFGNYIQLGGPNETGIAIKGSSDASGYSKTVRDNFIYFLNSGGTVAGVVGIALTGTAPAINFDSNQFRPRRAWVGGAGTSKFTNSATGKITGMVPATDSLNEFPVASNYSISFPASSSSLTQADVSSGVLSLPAASSRIGLSASSAVNVTSISLAGQNERMIVFVFNNTNMTFVKGAQMLMASNFSGPGTLFCDVRNESGTVYLYELGRTVI